jgi:hypothetical protein
MSLERVLSVVVDVVCWAVKSVLSLARSVFAPETSPEAKALSNETMSCVSVSNELLVLLSADVVLCVAELVELA